MFTGLIEEVGRVRRIQRASAGLQRLEMEARVVIEDLALGDSVSINGACQTVVHIDGKRFTVESVDETLKRTTLGDLRSGDAVNLERALRANDRLGGHMVLGHVDGVGHIRRMDEGSGQWTVAVEPPAELRRYIAAKGSIAIDGISLTVADVAGARAQGSGTEVKGPEVFTVAIIPHTFSHTHLPHRSVGDPVNLEVDVVARYVERLLTSDGQGTASGLQMEDLRRLGYS